MLDLILKKAHELGAEACVIKTSHIPFDLSLRSLCESNTCGGYNKSWQCPPRVGEVAELRERTLQYTYAVVCKTRGKISDSFDVDGMERILSAHRAVCDKIALAADGCVRLAAGGCRLCRVCAARENKPCRFPERACASPEAYGIDVTALADVAGISYRDDENEVAYFDLFLIP